MTYSEIEVMDKLEIAESFLLEEKNREAENLLRTLTEIDAGNEKLWLLLGIAKRRLGDLQSAIKCFKAAVELNSSSVETWGLLTISYLDIDNKRMAEKTIRQAYRLNPYNERLAFYKDNLVRIYQKFGPFFMRYTDN